MIYGPTPAEIVRKYTALTGRPALPPRVVVRAVAVHLVHRPTTTRRRSRASSRAWPSATCRCSVFHFDCFWMREFTGATSSGIRDAFPDPEGMLRAARERGLRHLRVDQPVHRAAVAALRRGCQGGGYSCSGRRRRVAVGHVAAPAWPWSTSPTPRRASWFADKLRGAARHGRGLRSRPTSASGSRPTWCGHDGSDPQRMHNYYTLPLQPDRLRGAAKSSAARARRCCSPAPPRSGGQQFPVHWGGDCESTFESMAERLRGGLSLGLRGFGFWSHDIGGFEGTPRPALFKRWVAFGLLSSHSRLHGSSSLPRAVAVRRGGGGGAALLHPAQELR